MLPGFDKPVTPRQFRDGNGSCGPRGECSGGNLRLGVGRGRVVYGFRGDFGAQDLLFVGSCPQPLGPTTEETTHWESIERLEETRFWTLPDSFPKLPTLHVIFFVLRDVTVSEEPRVSGDEENLVGDSVHDMYGTEEARFGRN